MSLDHEGRLQRMAQALVLDDGGRVDLRQSVVALVDQVCTVGPQLDPATGYS
ncbi:hypothetical protein J2X92_005743 [Variovorax paradoxus]|nr:hypothetical protein [Variovorax paradoxus]